MRLVSRFVLSTLILSALSVTALPQKQKRFCPVPPPSPFKHSGRIVTSFDRAAGGMRTTLEHPRSLGRGAEGLYLAASFVHQRNAPQLPVERRGVDAGIESAEEVVLAVGRDGNDKEDREDGEDTW